MSKKKVFVLNIGCMKIDSSRKDYDDLYHAILQDVSDYNKYIFQGNDLYSVKIKSVFFNYTDKSTNENKKVLYDILKEDVYPKMSKTDIFILILSGHGAGGVPVEEEAGIYRFLLEGGKGDISKLTLDDILNIFKTIGKKNSKCVNVLVANTCDFDADSVANQLTLRESSEVAKINIYNYPNLLFNIDTPYFKNRLEQFESAKKRNEEIEFSVPLTTLNESVSTSTGILGRLSLPDICFTKDNIYYSDQINAPILLIGTSSSKTLASKTSPGTYFMPILKGLLQMNLEMTLLDIYWNINTIYQKSKLNSLYKKLILFYENEDNPYFSISIVQPFNETFKAIDYINQLEIIYNTPLSSSK